jgi:hypothetical protein
MCRFLVFLVFLSVVCASASRAWHVYLDFDDDHNPWTIQTELPEGQTSDSVKVILELELGEAAPNGQAIEGWTSQGCCVQDGFTHYGTWGSFGFGYIDPSHPGWLVIPEGDPSTWSCPVQLRHGCTLNPSLPFVAGERYVIGSGFFTAFCDGPCDAPTAFDYGVLIGGSEVGSGTMRFHCPGDTPVEPSSWGRIKSRYRAE